MRTLVMGGTRFLGVAVLDELLARGHEVVVFNRGSRAPDWDRPVRRLTGDRGEPRELGQLRGLDVDAVVDMSAYAAGHTEMVLDALPEIPTFVHVSTLNVYRPSPLLPWPEDLPYGPHPLWGRYAENKIGCERALLARRPAPLRTVAVRLPLVLGPGNFIPREEFVLNRLLDDEVIYLPGDGQAVHQYVWIEHAAQALVGALDVGAEGFTAFNVASRRCVTSLEGFVSICAEVAGVKPRVRCVGGGPTGLGRPVFDNLDCVFPFSNENTVGALDAADRAGLLSAFLPLHDMIAVALDHLRAHPERRAWTRTSAERTLIERLAAEGATR